MIAFEGQGVDALHACHLGWQGCTQPLPKSQGREYLARQPIQRSALRIAWIIGCGRY
jgi:hypothetical protein